MGSGVKCGDKGGGAEERRRKMQCKALCVTRLKKNPGCKLSELAFGVPIIGYQKRLFFQLVYLLFGQTAAPGDDINRDSGGF